MDDLKNNVFARSRWLAGALVVCFFAWAITLLWYMGSKYIHRHHLLQHTMLNFPTVDSGNRVVLLDSLTGGRYTLVVFVSAACPHCHAELDTLAAIRPQFSDGLHFVVLSPSNSNEIASLRSQYPTLSIYQIRPSAFDATGLTGFPELLFLHNRIVTGLQLGERSPAEQVASLNRMMAAAP